MKIVWYVLRVKNMHFWSSSDPWGLLARPGKAELVHYVIRQDESELRILNTLKCFITYLPSFSLKQLCAPAHLGCTRKVGISE